MPRPSSPRPAVFLDRDGTINHDRGYVYQAKQWEWTPRAIEALAGFKKLGFLTIVVSNQSGIARGLYQKEDVDRLHQFVQGELAPQNAEINGFYYCVHHPDFSKPRNCPCRKPSPGMIRQAQQEHNIDLAGSYVIGDKAIDIMMARALGLKALLVETGYGKEDKHLLSEKTPLVPNLYEAYQWIKKQIEAPPKPK